MSEEQAEYQASRRCGNCRSNSKHGCTLRYGDWQTCQQNPSRPFWKSLKEEGPEMPDLKDDVKDWANADLETDYRPDSLVAQKKKRIRQLVDAHWSYMEKVLTVGQDTQQTYTFDQVMAIRKWDYTSVAAHFYGHGFEDAQQAPDMPEGVQEIFTNPKLEGKL
jgi:hypothetical protein